MSSINKEKLFCFTNDIPENVILKGDLAIDTEAMGLKIKRDRLCLIQICDSDNNVFLIHFPETNYNYNCDNLKNILLDKDRQKIFHYGRFDISIIRHYLGLDDIPNVYCTKIASRLTRTYTDHHGLKSLVNEILLKDLKKECGTSNWGSDNLSFEQKQYAINDVIFLHQIRENLNNRLKKLNRFKIANEYFNFLNSVCTSDLMDFEEDLFRHS